MKKFVLAILLIIPFVTVSTFAINWDNSSFLDEIFWVQNPTDSDIINALYGDWIADSDRTAYTVQWTGITCDTWLMTVEYLNPWTSTIPTTLNENTIYVLNSWTYITNAIINPSNCSVLVGKDDVKLYSSTNLVGMIQYTNQQNTIIDNIKIDGYKDGNWSVHTTKNTMWIYFRWLNNTINNIESINNSNAWIYIYQSYYNVINWSQFYNNAMAGLYFNSSENNIINNNLSYNNRYWFNISSDSNYNAINNSQFFNGEYGLYIYDWSHNIFKNISIYNNDVNGIFIRGINSSYCIGNMFVDVNIYNNYIGFVIQWTQSVDGIFYNSLNIANNFSSNFLWTTTNDNYLQPGTWWLLWRSDGVVDTWSISFSCDYVTWPDSFYLQGLCDQKDIITTYTNFTKNYKFWNNIPKQDTGVYYDTNNVLQVSWLPYDENQNIGITKPVEFLWNISLNNNQQTTESNQISVDLFAYTSGLNYTIFGDVEGSYNWTILENNKTLTITVSSWYGEKSISVQFFSWDETSPVYTKSITYVELSDPLVALYYGNNTLYTKNRELNTCDISQLSLQNINPGTNTIPEILSENTIYVLNSWTYITDTTINISSCSALIWNWNVWLYSSTWLTYMIYSSWNNAIISNIQIDGYGDGNGWFHDTKNNYGIYLYNNNNTTLYNISSYNNIGYWIYVYHGVNNIIEGSQIFNNYVGGIILTYGFGNKINNTLIFNNQEGIYITNNSERNTIENSQILNNKNGLYIYAGRYNLISNVLLYNNSDYGIFIRSIYTSYCPGNIFVDVSSYNNRYWFTFNWGQSTGNTYYNELNIFNNVSDNIQWITYLVKWTWGLMWWDDGIVNTDSIVLSSDYIINPKNMFGDFLLDPTDDPVNRIAQKNRSGTMNITYSFGNNLINQNNPVVYNIFYDTFQNIYYTNYMNIIYSNLWRNPIYPVWLNSFDLETYLWGNWYLKWTWSINTVSPTTLVGNSPIKWEYLATFNSGELDIPIVLQSTGTNPIEAAVPANTYIKNTSNQLYTWLIQAPIVIATWWISEVPNVCNAISVGTYGWESIYFKDANGNPTTVNVTMPVDSCGWFATWTDIGVYTREGTWPWTYTTNTTITTINDTKYITFDTIHFTDFAVWWEWTGTFVINNDAATTNVLDVILNMTMPMAISGMKFSNDGSIRSDREVFTWTKSRLLTGESGIKTVYAAFDYDGDTIADIQISDNITYNPNIAWVEQWNLTLEILTWTSECVYGTSLNLSWQDVKLNEWYTFTGSFSGQWYCADYVGVSDGWVLDISVSDLTNEWGNIISWSLITIWHDWATTQGDSTCTWYDGTPSTFNTEPYELIEKPSWSDKICKVTLNNVNIEVAVPAFQAPGNYNGTLTLTVPNF